MYQIIRQFKYKEFSLEHVRGLNSFNTVILIMARIINLELHMYMFNWICFSST